MEPAKITGKLELRKEFVGGLVLEVPYIRQGEYMGDPMGDYLVNWLALRGFMGKEVEVSVRVVEQ